ncbi:MAG: AraC family transcriptional regulator [Peptoniphilus sp.]|nr:AraC family transcriptional regulator [Peptoniphilus sp.]MDD7363085.1 AraC family transcriptional regulator [Bacillota bacterium]MDY6044413.1 AraC family transcriptional regulator [Peptoniphilus sp.]
MSRYYEFVKEFMACEECRHDPKYSSAGHTFCIHADDREGIYWFYESDNFIIDIHDFFIKKEIVDEDATIMSDYMSVYSSYIVSANGETFNPYRTLEPHSLYVLDFYDIGDNYRFLLHGNSTYLGVAVAFKKEFLEAHLKTLGVAPEPFFSDVFSNNRSILTKSLEPIAMDILNCKMEAPAANIFFEAKAKEWMSRMIDAYLNRKEVSISPDDEEALENVANYLDDHYALNVHQQTLEKISTMSGTKLKKLFKEKYQLSITEYTQRRRMNMAEVLLLNTPLSIKEIAESVGYSSHSKFSAYFKKYKGMYPREVRKLSKEGREVATCEQCDK